MCKQIRLSNSVWEIASNKGEIFHDQKFIIKDIVDHFRTLFSQPHGLKILEQMDMFRNFPCMFDSEKTATLLAGR